MPIYRKPDHAPFAGERPAAMPFAQFDLATAPALQVAGMVIDGFSLTAQYQLWLMQSYTEFAVDRLQDALTVRDADSLYRFCDNHSRASVTLGRELAERTLDLLSHDDDSSRCELWVIETDVEPGRRAPEYEAGPTTRPSVVPLRIVESPAPANDPQASDHGGPPDAETNQRISAMPRDQKQRLYRYERRNKIRKTFYDASQRRL